MIRSTADLIADFHSDINNEGNQHTSALKKRNSDGIKLKRVKQNVMHRLCTKAYFIRFSWINKIKYIVLMLRNIKSIDSLALLLNTFCTTYTKVLFYYQSMQQINFEFDKKLADHNRMLEEDVMKRQIEIDLKFFKELDDIDQISFIIDLFRVSGGSIVEKFFNEIKKEYQRRLSKTNSDLTVKISRLESSSKLIVVVESNESLTDEVIEQRKQWDIKIKKYAQEVDMKMNKLKQTTKKDEQAKKKVKDKKTKSENKGEITKRNGNEDEEFDWVELMPVWILKKILNYLDPKTLQIASTVSNYWYLMVQDVLNDRKVRKLIDKSIRTMESKLSRPLNPLTTRELIKTKKKKKLTAREKRLALQSLYGTTLKNALRLCNRNELREESLLLSLAEEMADYYILPIEFLGIFPRITTDPEPLYEKFPWIYKDVNLYYYKNDSLYRKEETTAASSTEFSRNKSDNSLISLKAKESVEFHTTSYANVYPGN